MNYNQIQFWLLFAALLLPYWLISHRSQNRLLLVASYVFYGFWDYRFLFLILISTVIDFIGGLGVRNAHLERRSLVWLGALVVGAALLLTTGINYRELWNGHLGAALPTLGSLWLPATIATATLLYGWAYPRICALPDEKRRKTFLVISMVANLGILGFFKYCDFFIASATHLLNAVGLVDGDAPVLGIILPAGISFYTFQAMSYTIDIYRGELEPTRDLGDFALFVCFFPHLVAGPIMRAHDLLPQVLRKRERKQGDVEEGLLLIVIGLFKKVAVADNVAPIANAVFSRLASGDVHKLNGPMVLVGVYAFAVQIYCDFSGYSAIARGVSKWLGFELVINFRQPYIAVSPSDFWRRWHISLSSWLRDYLYIPLGGNRRGGRLEYRNLMITMLLGGLWHGASWTFVAWGLYHGAILCGFRLARVRDVKRAEHPVRWLLRVVVMFHLTCLGWLLFRADSFASVGRALRLLVTDVHPSMLAGTALLLLAFYSSLLFVLEAFSRGEELLARLMRSSVATQALVYTYLLGMIFVFPPGRAYDFIYFQF